jgi:uncharacterized protein
MAKSRKKHPLIEQAASTLIEKTESNETSRPTGARPLRILSLDGGPAALLVVLMLTDLEERVPGFLANIDVIAGTSAGAITGLMLATKENPAFMLPVAANFWRDEQKYYKNSLLGYVKAVAGVGPFNDCEYVKQFLAQGGVLGDRKLKDLAKWVILTSFDISAGQVLVSAKSPLNWRPKIFQNMGLDRDDQETLAVDAALCSSASPIVTAVHRGKVDGGLVANNPSMIAIAEVFQEGMRPTAAALQFPRDHQGILMLSVGGGRADDAFKVSDANWGYFRWLLNPLNPLLLLNGFLSGTTEAIVKESEQILDEPKFRRLDPFYTESDLLPFVQADPRKQQRTAASALTQELIKETAEWLQTCGWLQDVPQPAMVSAGG